MSRTNVAIVLMAVTALWVCSISFAQEKPVKEDTEISKGSGEAGSPTGDHAEADSPYGEGPKGPPPAPKDEPASYSRFFRSALEGLANSDEEDGSAPAAKSEKAKPADKPKSSARYAKSSTKDSGNAKQEPTAEPRIALPAPLSKLRFGMSALAAVRAVRIDRQRKEKEDLVLVSFNDDRGKDRTSFFFRQDGPYVGLYKIVLTSELPREGMVKTVRTQIRAHLDKAYEGMAVDGSHWTDGRIHVRLNTSGKEVRVAFSTE